MKLVTYRAGGTDHLGALVGEAVADLSSVAPSMVEFIRGGPKTMEMAQVHLSRNPTTVPLTSVRLMAPVVPGKTLCSGINYRSHADENPDAKMPSYPHFFAKLSTAIANPEDEIEAPEMTKTLDYEVEFAVLIGKRLTRPSEADVMDAIFGYTLLNDVSARDVQFADSQITTGKNFDRFAPIGPCIVTTDELTAPDRVALRTRLNGKVMQDGTTADWLFPLPRLVGYLASIMTLEPGDIVSTGTPAGVGYFRKPQVFMKPGDIIEIEGEGIGVLRNRIVAQGTLRT